MGTCVAPPSPGDQLLDDLAQANPDSKDRRADYRIWCADRRSPAARLGKSSPGVGAFQRINESARDPVPRHAGSGTISNIFPWTPDRCARFSALDRRTWRQVGNHQAVGLAAAARCPPLGTNGRRMRTQLAGVIWLDANHMVMDLVTAWLRPSSEAYFRFPWASDTSGRIRTALLTATAAKTVD